MSRELEVIKEDYVRSYSYMICQKLFELAPDIAKREFGTIENCIREVQDDAREWFEKCESKTFFNINFLLLLEGGIYADR